jgi:hypothetical protein
LRGRKFHAQRFPAAQQPGYQHEGQNAPGRNREVECEIARQPAISDVAKK